MIARRALVPAGLVAALGSVWWSSAHLETMREGSASGAQVLYLPSGQYLKVISMGFSEVMSDLIYIWSIQYYSNYDSADRFKYLEHIYSNVIAELDPRYVDPYLIGALIMSTEAGDDAMALRLLDKGIAANPGEWILPFDAGFLCYDKLRDYARAARYFEKAMESPEAPAVVRRLHAEMYNKMGDKRASLAYWREVLESAESDYVRNVSNMHVHDLAIEVDLERLRAALESWRGRFGANPPALSALQGAGLIDSVPLDPEGRPYRYDPATGEVGSQSRFMLRRGQGA